MRYLEQLDFNAPTDLELMTVVAQYDDDNEPTEETPDDLDDEDYGFDEELDADEEPLGSVDDDLDEDFDLAEEGEEDNYDLGEETDEEELL